MAIHNVVFPPRISYGAVGGPRFKTTILPLASGHEKRNIDWKMARAEYDVAYGLKTKEEFDEVRRFFYARHGRAYGFLFKDWQDYVLERQPIYITDLNTNIFQIYKRYQSGTSIYDRPLTKIVPNTTRVWINEVELTPQTQFTVNVLTGKITVQPQLVNTQGATVSAACEFYVPVRFDTDFLASSLEEYNVLAWGQIPLVEVRE